jgi:hypothetical protein
MSDVEHIGQGSERWAKVRDEFVEAQAGQCGICRVPLVEPQLDHCHAPNAGVSTGKPR